jgi:hypothetical protein
VFLFFGAIPKQVFLPGCRRQHLLIRAENELPYGNLPVAAGFSLRKPKLAATF